VAFKLFMGWVPPATQPLKETNAKAINSNKCNRRNISSLYKNVRTQGSKSDNGA